MRNYIIGLYLVLGLIGTVHAQTQTYQLINGIKVEAVAVSSAQRTATGTVMQGIQFRAQSGTTPPKFYQRAVDFSKGTTATSIKSFAKGNAFQLGLTAAILGLGWAMDELTGQIYPVADTGASPAISCNPYYITNGFTASSACTASALQSAWQNSCNLSARESYGPLATCIGTLNIPSSGNISTDFSISCPYPYCQPAAMLPRTEYTSKIIGTFNQPATGPTATPASDSQIADTLTPQLTPDALKKLHTDPVTGAIQKPQEVLNKMTEVANQYARELNPESVNATVPTAVAIPAVSELPATDTLPSTGLNLEFPEFCEWASFLCEEPTEPTDSNWTVASLITEDEIEVQSYNSGLGSGSCPSPAVFMVLGTSLEYSYEPVCELAGVAKFFVLLFAYISSIYILLGIKR